jgi:hypothetical protein
MRLLAEIGGMMGRDKQNGSDELGLVLGHGHIASIN